MPFVLKFVQRYRASEREAFMKLEAKFAAMERRRPEMPKATRMTPYAGREPSNTLIWECAFDTLDDAQKALALLASDPEHEGLFRQQVAFFEDAYTEIYEVLEF
jgi:hypothetical protein